MEKWERAYLPLERLETGGVRISRREIQKLLAGKVTNITVTLEPAQ
jgi:hypothetical protein